MRSRASRALSPFFFTYKLEAEYPVKVQGAEARVYEYYNPQNETRIQQEPLMVSE